MVLEMLLWRTQTGMKTFGTKADNVNYSATLAANIGVYNGFLAGGLFYAIATGFVRFFFFFPYTAFWAQNKKNLGTPLTSFWSSVS